MNVFIGLIVFLGAFAFGAIFTAIVFTVGEDDHRESDYKAGYDRGYSDGVRDTRRV